MTKYITSSLSSIDIKVIKGALIRNRYNQAPHLSQDTTWVSSKTHLNIINESQKVSHFPGDDQKAAMKRRKSMKNTRQK